MIYFCLKTKPERWFYAGEEIRTHGKYLLVPFSYNQDYKMKTLVEMSKILAFSDTQREIGWTEKNELFELGVIKDPYGPDLMKDDTGTAIINMANGVSFFCLLDKKKHLKTDEAYMCKSCGQYVCANCHEGMEQAGMKESCVYCSGHLVKIQ